VWNEAGRSRKTNDENKHAEAFRGGGPVLEKVGHGREAAVVEEDRD
jgi:hypothetical protein